MHKSNALIESMTNLNLAENEKSSFYFQVYQLRHKYLSNPTIIITLRLEMKLSQVELSKAIGLSRIQYGNIEKGKISTTKKTALKISSHFGKTISEVFSEVGGHYVAKKSAENSSTKKMTAIVIMRFSQ